MEKIEKLGINDILSVAPLHPAAYSISEPGACGGYGEVLLNCIDGKIYQFSFLRRIITSEQLEALCPTIAITKLQIGGQGDFPPAGWVPIYLGLGNHLFVKEDLFDDFVAEAEEKNISSRGELYKRWPEILRSILDKNESNHKDSSHELNTCEIELPYGKENFDIIAKNSHLMFEGPFTILDLLK